VPHWNSKEFTGTRWATGAMPRGRKESTCGRKGRREGFRTDCRPGSHKASRQRARAPNGFLLGLTALARDPYIFTSSTRPTHPRFCHGGMFEAQTYGYMDCLWMCGYINCLIGLLTCPAMKVVCHADPIQILPFAKSSQVTAKRSPIGPRL
jgi:hypothetical protein